MSLWSASPDQFIDALKAAGLRRAYLVTDPADGQLKGSHEVLTPLVEAVSSDARDYFAHEGVFFEIGVSEKPRLLVWNKIDLLEPHSFSPHFGLHWHSPSAHCMAKGQSPQLPPQPSSPHCLP